MVPDSEGVDMKHADKVNTAFVYTNAADSSRPGYLKAKFDRERKRLREIAEREKARPRAVVRKIEAAR